MYLKRFLVIFFATLISGIKLPDKFVRCKVSVLTDNTPNECLKDAINKGILYLSEYGDADLKALSLDPLRINTMEIFNSDSNSALASKFILKNIDLTGFKTWNGTRVTGRLSSPKNFKMIIEGNLRNIDLNGEYEAAGRILALPISGSGNCVLKLDGVHVKAIIKAIPDIKQDEEYLKLSSIKISVSIKRLYSHYDNLFNLDRVLGDNMNLFLNENWETIFEELRPSVEKAFSDVFFEYTRRILDVVPYKEIFILE